MAEQWHFNKLEGLFLLRAYSRVADFRVNLINGFVLNHISKVIYINSKIKRDITRVRFSSAVIIIETVFERSTNL